MNHKAARKLIDRIAELEDVIEAVRPLFAEARDGMGEFRILATEISNPEGIAVGLADGPKDIDGYYYVNAEWLAAWKKAESAVNGTAKPLMTITQLRQMWDTA